MRTGHREQLYTNAALAFGLSGRFLRTPERAVALRNFVKKLTQPVDEFDREKLTTWCAEQGAVRMDEIPPRRPVFVAGEIHSVRIVPRAGAASLEASVQDGHGSVTAVFLGRRKIAGLDPGRRVLLEGVVSDARGNRVMYNPLYTLV
jgi:hypothetical protein